MASWKKVIVSGSNANLTALQVDNLLNGVVTGSSNGTLGIQAINGTGNIVATTGATNLVHSGSFSGSFQGSFTGLINSASYAATASFITASGVYGPYGSNSVISSSYAVSSSYTVTSSFAISSSYTLSSSYAVSASISATALTASYVTASAVYGPYGSNSVVSASYAVSSSYNVSSSYAVSASRSETAGQTQATLTFGEGLSSGTFNGATAVTLTVSGAAQLTDNAITKWDDVANKFVVSSLTDNGTVVSGASSIILTGANSALTGSFTGSFFGDGSGLTGLVSTLRISGSNYVGQPITSGSIALGTQGLTILGTQNEITVEAVNQTITVGLPNDVTIGNNLIVTGDLTVNGTTTTIDTTNLLIEDKFILLANGTSTATDGGIIVSSAAGTGYAFGYDDTADRWVYQDALSGTATAFGTITAYSNTTQYGTSGTKPSDVTGPAYGGATAGYGNTWVSTDTGEIWIYS